MSTETIFFSYSRDNTEFVLNLAKSLRKAGANIWLDQLDIKPGTRWDSSIEKALESSKTLLVILSNTSVASHNVMDEVSYALGENKKVVPVLLEECAIPFRLKRLQYADFTTDHQEGLKTLAAALDLDQIVAEKLTEATPENNSMPEKKTVSVEKKSVQKEDVKLRAEQAHLQSEQKKEPKPVQERIQSRPNPSPTASSKNPKNRVPLYIGGGLVLLLGILWMSGIFDSDVIAAMSEDTEDVIVSEVGEPFEGDEVLSSDGTISNDNAGLQEPEELGGDVVATEPEKKPDSKPKTSDPEPNVPTEVDEQFEDDEVLSSDGTINNDNEGVQKPEELDVDMVAPEPEKKPDSRPKTSNPEPNVPDEEPSTPEPIVVNGQNVTIVQYTDGQIDPAGYFRQVGPNKWEEESLIHSHLTPFVEVMRDEWSVYLSDRSRDLTIQLDLHTRRVNLNYNKPDRGMLYTISDAKIAQ